MNETLIVVLVTIVSILVASLLSKYFIKKMENTKKED
jgi:NhaP-type Na+/H+ or K+/H+ antiporter